MDWFIKVRRAASVDDFERWERGGVCPTLNVADNTGDVRATVVMVTGFNWQNGGGYGNANPGLGITVDGVGPLSTSQVPAVAFALRGREEGGVPEVSGNGDVVSALRASSGGSSRDYVASASVRRLTPRECERLQGFPDDWTAGQADSHRYKEMGNAVTVNVANYIACLVNMAVGSNDVGSE